LSTTIVAKDPKLQEVLRDLSVLDADIRSYLEAENDYAKACLAIR